MDNRLARTHGKQSGVEHKIGLTFEDWHLDDRMHRTAIRAKTIINKGDVRILTKDGCYSLAEVSSTIAGIIENSIYVFSIDLHCSGMQFKVICTWLDSNGTELKRAYLKKKDTIFSPKKAAKLRVSVIGFGFSKGVLQIKEMGLSYKEPYQQRLATLAALTIDYGFVKEHSARTCEDNLQDSLNSIDRLMKEYHADLIVLTECFYTRCIGSIPYPEGAISIDSPQIQAMQNKAKEYKVYLSFSFLEKTKEGQIHNTAVMINREGEIIAQYHKTHLTVNEYEAGLVPGNEVVVVDTDFGKVGLAICWDFFFPEFIRMMQLKGAEIIVNPTAGYMKEQSIMRARDFGIYVVTSGVMRSKTNVISPEGSILSQEEYNGAAVATVDLNQEYLVKYLSVRSYASRKNVYYYERRPDLYQPLSDEIIK